MTCKDISKMSHVDSSLYSHRKKRENKIRKEIKRGIRETNTEDPFELFLSLQNIRYVYYKETEKILGNTFGMCILQDFEAITPNLLARTIETVEGGGLVLLLLKGMKSLKQLYTLSMDVHSRYRTEAHDDVVARFNERFVLSLGSCDSCLFVDDELNVLPISGGKNVTALAPVDPEEEGKSKSRKELDGIKESLANSQPVGSLIKVAKTVDQAKALLTFVDAIAEKTLRSTVTLTAARGRGKSAALGVAIAAAVAHGYSNIFITSPSPENLKTLFEFIFKGFDALGYLDHEDYTIIQSVNPDFNKAIVRVNIHRQHRQTIQYILPQDANTLGQAELLVIDEAAAIPLPLVRKLMGPYLVFMASTINGYEGTGRSLSLKLIQQLREEARGSVKKPNGMTEGEVADRSNGNTTKNGDLAYTKGRSLREITLSEPIRYAEGDLVEKWLNKLLCLDAASPPAKPNNQGCPHPSKCELLEVNRDTLFSFHPVSEKFLHQMMALYVASHYKNSPNDLQLMSDAPAHRLFVLVPPVNEDSPRLPEPLCVIQIALEGQISKESILSGLTRGQRAEGDLIPWLVSQKFEDPEFASLSGARIVRIATSPEYTNMGYGSQALKCLVDFYEGKMIGLSEIENTNSEEVIRVTDAELEKANLLSENLKVRDIQSMPPLFTKVFDCRPPRLDYLGVSFGLTAPLHKFWKRASFSPVYLRSKPNDLTGDHSCAMLRTLTTSASDGTWLPAYTHAFHDRFLSRLPGEFRVFPSIVALSINESANAGSKLDPLFRSSTHPSLTKSDLDVLFPPPFDLKLLDSYANNMRDYDDVSYMIPKIAHLYFTGRVRPAVSLTGVQSSLLLAIGLQFKAFDDVMKELNLPMSQLLAMFVKIVRKFASYFRTILEQAVQETMPVPIRSARDDDDDNNENDEGLAARFKPLPQRLDDELREGGEEVLRELKEKQRALIDALPLDRYELETDPAAWDDAERQVQRRVKVSARDGDNDNDPEGPPADVTVSVRAAEHHGDNVTTKRDISGASKNAETDKRGGKDKTGGKRKVETADDIYAQEIGNKLAKRGKRGKGGKKS